MNWFERLTGFPETSYEKTRALLQVDGDRLRSTVNGRSYRVGTLDRPSLRELRTHLTGGPEYGPRLKFRNVTGDVRALHRLKEYEGALFQVASQFNMLEMQDPSVTPEAGVTGYKDDRTQGPACAIAAGAATIYRNYFAIADGHVGQTKDHQIDALADLREMLSEALNRPPEALWTMRNGYALPSKKSLSEVNAHLDLLEDADFDDLKGHLRIGVQWDVEVTETNDESGHLVSQAFCSALPVRYSGIAKPHWTPFAQMILEAAYEATLCAAFLNARRGASNIVLLTSLGGGAFGNDETWIDDAIENALARFLDFDLDVRLVNFHGASKRMEVLERAFSPARVTRSRGLKWKSDGNLCPICSGPGRGSIRYSAALCAPCEDLMVDAHGSPIEVTGLSKDGCFLGIGVITGDERDAVLSHDVPVFAKGVECRVREAHMGGAVAQPLEAWRIYEETHRRILESFESNTALRTTIDQQSGS